MKTELSPHELAKLQTVAFDTFRETEQAYNEPGTLWSRGLNAIRYNAILELPVRWRKPTSELPI